MPRRSARSTSNTTHILKTVSIQSISRTNVGDRTNLLELTQLLKEYLSEYDSKIADVEIKHGPNRAGDIPHSLASIEKAKSNLGYDPQYNIQTGLKEAVKWYWENLK